MKLLYIANARMPTDQANGKQIAEMCEALATGGSELTLVIPDRSRSNPMHGYDVYKYYQIESNFKIEHVPVIDTFSTNLPLALSFQLLNLSFALGCFRFVFDRRQVFTRSKLVGTLLAVCGKHVVFEAHDSAHPHILNSISARRFKKVVTISKSIDQSWTRLNAKTVYLPDGLNRRWLELVHKVEARERLKLSPKKPLLIYTGTLTPWKGSETLIKASQASSKVDFYCIGRVEEATTGNLKLISHQPAHVIRLWQAAADILIIPNSAKYKKGRQDTSPLKLFEYMASGRPILASDVPAIREIVDESKVTFFKPDNHIDLIDKVKWILENPKEAEIKAIRAIAEVKKYTWNNRAKKILELFQ